MAALVGTRLGVYEVIALIGAGGMGEVYRARDTRLGRDVAIKVLPASVATDPERLARFEREAQLLASLNHPNIGAIYGVEETGGLVALVLELVEGETLEARLKGSRAMALADALAIARQIADALDAAHERGIVHRDLKPANIAIAHDGAVKVLDFGLAKFDEGSASLAGERNLTHSPTMMAPTVDGVLLGTAPYMSPEQARGRVVDKRTDIWAFGCVLYEMLTGRRAFAGETATDVLAKIVERDPDWAALPASTSPKVIRLLRRCLEKDPKKRLRDIGDVSADLGDVPPDGRDGGTAAGARRPRGREYLAWLLAAISLVALTVVLFRLSAATMAPRASVVRATLVLPGSQHLASGTASYPLALSPDGTRLAYVADVEGRSELYIRELKSLEPSVLAGTDGATQPFFSPDGQWIGFFAAGALQKVSIAGGAPIRICNISAGSMGGAWGRDNTIVFALRGSGLSTVNAAGGAPTRIAGTDGASWPDIAANGGTVLFTIGVGGEPSALATISIRGGQRRIIARTNESPLEGPALLGTGGLGQARFVEGHLVYGQSPGFIRAMPFDLSSGGVTGAAVSMVDSVERGRGAGAVYFVVSSRGLLVYASTGDRHQLVWVDRNGTSTPISADRLAFRHPRLSPDGKRIVVAINDETRRSDIWIYDAERGTKSRLTTERHNLRPLWSVDGARVTFSSSRGEIDEVAADAGGRRDVLIPPADTPVYSGSWSPDGQTLLLDMDEPAGARIGVFRRGGELHALLGRPVNESRAMFSPNGRWVAFASTESGRNEIFVGGYPDLANRIAVSTDGGDEPRWSRDGRELFFRQGDAVMAAAIDTSRGLSAAKPQRLFTGSFSGAGRETGFDVALDGRRFVMVKSDEASTLRQMTVVHNWIEELKARVPMAK